MIKNLLLSLSDLFYPPHCAGCRRALLKNEYLCGDCWNRIEPISKPCCSICSYPLFCSDAKNLSSQSLEAANKCVVPVFVPSSLNDTFSCHMPVASLLSTTATLKKSSAICMNCSGRELHFVAGVSAFRYRDLTQELLARYKYGRDQSLTALLQRLIVKALEEERLQEIVFVAVVPVPLHPLRQRERGFNQVLPLAREVARFKNLPLHALLKRVVRTSLQVGSHRQERLKNLEDAFALRYPCSLHGNYLLVDDVLTTGATLDECAKVLLEAGADGVWAVTVAR